MTAGDGSALDQCWFAVATVDAIAAEPTSVELRGVGYVIWRAADGDLIAAQDRCSHREARLSLGAVKDGCLQCPYHGWTFGAGGRCLAVPSSGAGAAIPPGAHLDSVAIVERYGLVWLCPAEPRFPIPELGVDDDRSFTRLNTGMQVWKCSATRMIDNMLDVAHFPFTHAGTFGRQQETVVPKFALTQLDDSFHGYEYSVVINNEGEAKAMSGGGEDVIGLEMSTGFALPFSVRSTMSYENGIEQTLFMTAAPMSAGQMTAGQMTAEPATGVAGNDQRSYFTFVLWRNDDVATTGQQIVDFELEVAREDQAMLERVPGELALGRGELVDVRSDKASVEWRRQYRRLISG